MDTRYRFLLIALALALVTVASPMKSRAQGNNPLPLLVQTSPTAAAPGGAAFTLSVLGGNFTAGSVLNWNGSARTTTFVSSAKLTAAITAADIAAQGTATITVTNPAPGGGRSGPAYFSIVPAASRINFSVGSVTNAVPIIANTVDGDFNNDGKVDLAVATATAVFVLLGNGDGTFQPAIGSSTNGVTVGSLQAADVNQDGNLDLLATGNDGTNEMLITFFGNGNGTFQAPVTTIVAASTAIEGGTVFADFGHHGAYDAAYTINNQIIVMSGSANGTFAPGSVTAVTDPTHPQKVFAVGDFSGVGNLGLVIQTFTGGSMQPDEWRVYEETAGTFNSTGVIINSSFGGAWGATVGDFNGDGKLDVATVEEVGTFGTLHRSSVMLNNGNSAGRATFQSPVTIPNLSQGSATSPIAADFNGDGIPDLAIGSFIYFGQGDGTFPTSTGSPASFTFDVAGDFNGDGKPDLLTRTAALNPNTGVLDWVALGTLLQIPPAPDFSGSVAPNVVMAGLNSTSNVTISLTPLYGFTSDVTLSVSGLPAGVTPTFTPAMVTGGKGSSNLALTLNGSVPLGSYNITITGTGGGITHSSSIPMLVNSSPGDFGGSISPDTRNIIPGNSASFTVMISPTGGFTGTVSLTLSGGLPPGSTYSFVPATITGGSGTSTLTINTPTGLAANVYSLTITAASGTLSKSHTVLLGVNPAGGDFTGTFTTSQTSVPTGLVQYNFYLTSIGGYVQPVIISMTGFPAGAVNDGPVSVTPGSAGGIHVTLTNVAQGTYPLLVTFTGTGVVHQATVQLVIN